MSDDLKKATVSMSQKIYERGKSNAKTRGFKNSFSAYVAWLIERDDKGAVEREQLAEGKPTSAEESPIIPPKKSA